jgi:hypothetical protein
MGSGNLLRDKAGRISLCPVACKSGLKPFEVQIIYDVGSILIRLAIILILLVSLK